MGRIIGIDLGTTNSCIAVLERGQPVVIANSEGGRTTPSTVGFSRNGEVLIGTLGKRQRVTNAEHTIYSIKRFIGRRWGDTAEEQSRVPYICIRGKDDTVNVQIRDKVFTPQEISAFILKKLKQDAENYLGEPVVHAVITVPAYFTDAQRQATKDAGTIAGLEVLRVIHEPTAAALSFGLNQQDVDQTVLVYDLGGGTFDVSILQMGDRLFQVKATAGNNHLGGDDFDNAIVSWLANNFRTQEGIDLTTDKMALQRLREAAEKAKIELSSTISTVINLPFITTDGSGPKHLETELTRATFEALVGHLVQSTIEPITQILRDANLSPSQIDRILLVGGSTRIPLVQQTIRQYFGKQPDRSVNPDEAVALGAAIQAGVLDGETNPPILLDVAPLSLGVETLGGVFTRIIERNTTIPTSMKQTFSTAADGQTCVEIHVLQGERTMAKDNHTLGKFELTNIPAAPRGIPQIEVTFEIDVNGILQVSARNKGTGQEQSIRTSYTGGLTQMEIDQKIREFQQLEESDRLRRELAELRNKVDWLLHLYETTVRDYETRIPEDYKIQARNIATELQTAIATHSIGTIDDLKNQIASLKTQINEFEQIIYEIGTLLNQFNDPNLDETIPWNGSDDDNLAPSGIRPRFPRQPNHDSDGDAFAGI